MRPVRSLLHVVENAMACQILAFMRWKMQWLSCCSDLQVGYRQHSGGPLGSDQHLEFPVAVGLLQDTPQAHLRHLSNLRQEQISPVRVLM